MLSLLFDRTREFTADDKLLLELLANPLAVVVGQLQLLRDRTDVPERIDAAVRAIDRIRAIVDHMVQVTRLEASRDWPPALPPMLDIRRSSPQGGDSRSAE